MPLTLLAPARLPEAIIAMSHASQRLVNLERLLASASITVDPRPVERWLSDQLGIVADSDAPIAPLRLAMESAAYDRDARDGYWMCADPIAATTGIDAVRIDHPIDDLDAADAENLVGAISGFFAVDGLRMIAATPSRWYVRTASPQQLSTTPLDRALGRSMLPMMPAGVDSAIWRSRLNEVQMLLYEHPVNRGRERRGQVPVASCWWWGGGRWPTSPTWRPAPLDVVIVEDTRSWIEAACRENHIAIERPHADAEALALSAGRRVLIVAETGLSMPDQSVARWQACDRTLLAALVRALDERAIAGALIALPWNDSTLHVTLTQPNGIARWRRWMGRAEPPSRPLSEVLRPYLQ